ncbi:MAG: class I SAM-dependent methyltransferase [Deltaproteobacteria bacterium]|nr:class I SAM-dependent methyltransferase [Deltaproteobacteria bacterium]
MDRTRTGSEIRLNRGVFYYTGNPLLILNLNGKRECKLLLADRDDIELLSLIREKGIVNDDPALGKQRAGKVRRWVEEGILIEEDPRRAEKPRANNLIFPLFREYAAGQVTGERHSLVEYHREKITDPREQFEDEEITLAHMYRFPHPALRGVSYGARFAQMCLHRGLVKAGAKILEVGGGTGYFGNAFLTHLREEVPDLYRTIHYTFFELSPVLLVSQREKNSSHKNVTSFIEGNIEDHDFGEAEFSLVISNEMIADLGVAKLKKAYFLLNEMPPESLREIVAFCKKCGLTFDDAFEEFLVNIGAFRFLSTLGKMLAPDGAAVIVEYGDMHLYPSASVLGNHTEYSIHFGHLVEVAKRLGFAVEYSDMPDFFGFKTDERVLDYLSFTALKEHILPFFGRTISHVAYTEERLGEALGAECLPHLHGLRFSPVSEARGRVNPQDFKALVLTRT